MSFQALLFGSILSVLGVVLGYFIRELRAYKQASSTEQKAKEIVLEAEKKAAALVDEARKEERERKQELKQLEDRLHQKEENLDKRFQEISTREESLKKEQLQTEEAQSSIEEKRAEIIERLEKVSELSREEAKNQILKDVSEEYSKDLSKKIQELEHIEREEIEKKSLEIITGAIQRYARSHVAELTTSVFHLKNEDLKGKIIGREGRNIRALERTTGVEIIMDEAPDSIVLSSFDPLRREIAKSALEKLIEDGRIQPAKIEEKVEEAKNEINKRMVQIGEEATIELGIVDLPKEIIQLIGRLYFRTSYGQNVLVHSLEMGHISGMIAAELGANVEVAKKGALVHDIGKAISHEVEGTHVELGRKILQKYGVDEAVVKAMESHHEEYPFSTPESFIVAAADIISAARPGARRDNIENYLKRLEDLEKIATEFDGVKNAYALSAGREIRVFVVPEKIDDFGALQLAKDVANKIQSDLKYPGEIKVNIIRESRAVEYAR
jgi:ribonucrease Y